MPAIRQNPSNPRRSTVRPLQARSVSSPPPDLTHRGDGRLRAGEDLRGYLAQAEMPSIARWDRSSPYYLPPRGRRSNKNRLRVRKDPNRCIEIIRRHDTNAFNDATEAYHNDHIYDRYWRPFTGRRYFRRNGEALALDAEDFVLEEGPEDIPYPNNIDDTCRWLKKHPFKTMQRAIHLAFPDTMRWLLKEANEEIAQGSPEGAFANRDKWRTYVWRFHPDSSQPRDVRDPESGEIKTEAAPRHAMAVVVQAPWILARKDMKKVTECTKLPSLPDDEVFPETRLNSQRRVWANIHDTCRRLNCRSFVLTTYHCWTFGKFSEDMKSVEISEVKDFDATEPTVMQMLVYWVAKSMGLGDASDGEKVKVKEEAGPSTERRD